MPVENVQKPVSVFLMTFLMKSISLGKEKYGMPEKESGVYTNFIE